MVFIYWRGWITWHFKIASRSKINYYSNQLLRGKTYGSLVLENKFSFATCSATCENGEWASGNADFHADTVMNASVATKIMYQVGTLRYLVYKLSNKILTFILSKSIYFHLKIHILN